MHLLHVQEVCSTLCVCVGGWYVCVCVWVGGWVGLNAVAFINPPVHVQEGYCWRIYMYMYVARCNKYLEVLYTKAYCNTI